MINRLLVCVGCGPYILRPLPLILIRMIAMCTKLRPCFIIKPVHCIVVVYISPLIGVVLRHIITWMSTHISKVLKNKF